MECNRKLLIVAGVCATLPTAGAWSSGAGRSGMSARHGQWTTANCHSTEFRRATGGEGFIEWLGEAVRITAGIRLVRERTLERAVDGRSELPPDRGETQLATSALAVARFEWLEVGYGVGYLGSVKYFVSGQKGT